MTTAGERHRRIRFHSFELDLHTRELSKRGVRLKLRGHPIDMLSLLLETPGELVTREALQQKLWPKNTFVDFEHLLNNSVNRLREALGDKAGAPRFIETLPGRGYRFIAAVEPLGRDPSTPERDAAAGLDEAPVAPVSSPANPAVAPMSPSPRCALPNCGGDVPIAAIFLDQSGGEDTAATALASTKLDGCASSFL